MSIDFGLKERLREGDPYIASARRACIPAAIMSLVPIGSLWFKGGPAWDGLGAADCGAALAVFALLLTATWAGASGVTLISPAGAGALCALTRELLFRYFPIPEEFGLISIVSGSTLLSFTAVGVSGGVLTFFFFKILRSVLRSWPAFAGFDAFFGFVAGVSGIILLPGITGIDLPYFRALDALI